MDSNRPHRRYNPLQDKWLLVSPQRFGRPWSGQREKTREKTLPAYDPGCYLCPKNTRTNKEKNPDYDSIFTFTNDFSAILPTTDTENESSQNQFEKRAPESGICEVICYSPKHSLTMASMSEKGISNVINCWKDRYIKLGRDPKIKHVQIFENRGSEVGNSNLHPHGQIWAQEHVPDLPATELRRQKLYFNQTGHKMLLDYLNFEIKDKSRMVFHNKHFTALVPYWAEWPYELLVLPNFKLSGLDKLPDTAMPDLAKTLQRVAKLYAVFFGRKKTGAPYTMGLHQKPTDGKPHPEIQLHFHFQPPLLTADRQKFMVGYERFAEAQRDLTVESAAQQLRTVLKKI